MTKKLYRDPDWLREQYWERGLTQDEIASMADCSQATIQKWMKKLGVSARSREEVSELFWQDPDYQRKHAKAMRDPETRRKLSESQKEVWSDPEYHERMCKAFQETWTDERREQRSEISRSMMEREDIRQRLSEAAKRNWETGVCGTEEHLAALSRAMEELWQDLEYRRHTMEAMSESMTSEKYRHLRSEIAQELWQDPDYRRKHAEAMRELYKDPDFLQKMSEASKRVWGDPEYRAKMCRIAQECWDDENYRQKHADAMRDPEVRKKISESQKETWSDPEYRRLQSRLRREQWLDPEYRQHGSEVVKQLWRDGIYDGFPQSPTQPEQALMAALDFMGIDYEFQHRPDGYSKPYDFYVPEANLLIEYDGWFWHHSEWAIEKGAEDRDREKDEYAEEHGYELLRVTERRMEKLGAWAVVVNDVWPLL